MDRGNGPVGPSYLYEVSGAATVVGQNGPVAGPPQTMIGPGNGVGPHGPHNDGIHDMGSGDQNYCLRWNEYEKKYVEAFRVLRDNEYFTDVTLAADGHTVKAHRVILSACSNYFHSILKNMGPWQHPVLLLQDVRPGDLTSLMDFIYFGQVNMNQDSLDGFLKIAEKLKIKGLCDTMAAGGSNQIILPPPPPHPAQVGLPSQVGGQRSVNNSGGSCIGPPPSVTHTGASSAGMNNFENLLPRSPYSMQDSLVPLPPQPIGVLPSAACRGGPPSSAPPAHQSPKPSRSSSTSSGSGAPPPAGSVGPTLVRQVNAEPLMYVSPNKRTKYSVQPPAMSPQSILRNQLQIAKEISQQQQAQQAQQQQQLMQQQQTQPQQLNISQAHHQQQQHSQHSISTAQHAAEHVEVKSEPMTILSTPDQDVPSSGVNVNEFMTGPHEGDLTLPPLGQGISPQFMFSPEPEAGGNQQPQPGAHNANSVVVSGGPPVATMVTIDDSRSSLRIEGGNIMTTAGSTSAAVAAATSAISGATSNSHHIHGHLPQHLHPQHLPVSSSTSIIQQQHVTGIVMQGGTGGHTSGSGTPVDEPQDLTPAQESMSHTPPVSATSNGNGGPINLPPPQLPNTPISNVSSLGGIVISAPPTPTTPTPGPPLNSSTPSGVNESHSPGTPTPPKKDRNSRKTCPYCHKDFHEMSLKRHIKDVHFRNQNTYVICPQCCKQYASQNSLYSHLNRVHGVKRDMMQDIQLQTVAGSNGGTSGGGGGSANTSGNGANNSGSSGGSTASGGGSQISTIANQHPPQQQPQQAPQGSHHHHGHHLSPQQSGVVAHQQQQQHVVHADNSHDGIMDLAHHSDSSN